MSTSPDSVSYPQTIAELLAPGVAPDWSNADRPDQPLFGMFGITRETGAFEIWDGSKWASFVSTSGATFTGLVTLSGGLTVPNGATVTGGSTSVWNFNSKPTFNSGASFPNGGATTVGSTHTWTYNGTPTFNSGFASATQNPGVQIIFTPSTGYYAVGNWAFSGTTTPSFGQSTAMSAKNVMTGSLTSSGDINGFQFQTNTDNVAMSGGGGVNGFEVIHFLGSSFNGSRRAVDINVSTTANNLTLTSSPFLTGLRVQSGCSHDLNGKGVLFGGNFNLTANGNIGALQGVEVDLKTTSAASAITSRLGYSVHINAGSVVQGSSYDTAYEASMDPGYSTDVGFKTILLLGKSNGGWPVDPSAGWIMATQYQTQASQLDASGIRPMAAAGGIDLWPVQFSGSAWRSSGVQINNTSVAVGSAALTQSGTTAQLDVTGYVGSLSSINAGGANYKVGDQVSDGLGGLLVVDTVSSGVVTALHYVRVPYYAGGAGPATASCKGGSGNQNLSINLTWTAPTGLSLNPTGAKIGFNGTAPIAKPTVTGSKGANAALASLLTALASYGLLTDSTT